MAKLVIVESPAKAKKLKAWLPKEHRVEASVGHIRDLPSGSKVPDRYKDQPVKHGVVIHDGLFEPIYVPTERGAKVIADLRKKMKGVDELFLATDPDREGESISWHLKEALNPKVPVRRVVFYEITKKAVQEAFTHPRAIDQELVNAQEARRVLDRLVGYEISPLLWTKIATGLSAGRVQSVALRILVDRERERMAFKPSAYWDLVATLAKDSTEFQARIFTVRGKEVATAKRFFDENTGKLLDPAKVVLLDEPAARDLAARLSSAKWRVASVEEQARTSRPYEPFITDTLVSAANARLNLSARDAMRVAQSLYENGYITYHRTDSPALSAEGVKGARDAATASFGREYLSPEPRVYASKAASAQEAHEGIRPVRVEGGKRPGGARGHPAGGGHVPGAQRDGPRGKGARPLHHDLAADACVPDGRRTLHDHDGTPRGARGGLQGHREAHRLPRLAQGVRIRRGRGVDPASARARRRGGLQPLRGGAPRDEAPRALQRRLAHQGPQGERGRAPEHVRVEGGKRPGGARGHPAGGGHVPGAQRDGPRGK
ncbi:MAG: hypothetical protein HYT80_00635, partial [Euryarchaeota archaeon]|nr:hypothetical protein [Euryarchaeota archaeon]